MACLEKFIRRERGFVTFDWIVLTAIIVLTGVSVLDSLSGGVETASVARADLRGEALAEVLAPETCPGGPGDASAREAARIAAGGSGPVDVTAMMARVVGLDEAEFRAERARNAQAQDRGDRNVAGAAGCATVPRGLE
ncbi:hypothetical protein JSE7799_00369 [Jannaschia seosinensis]|uniref:Uncharacterized protein n=1 Tax=Jannaschia seosinensis TaxID=313367 RepID=A0A0M7B788_9RHOB|nr:hypothetical protein [Jannaschia seosinensis]CUH16731.1 hypothetical protein JSE7799_00369 [Jannaschia seosinensis]